MDERIMNRYLKELIEAENVVSRVCDELLEAGTSPITIIGMMWEVGVLHPARTRYSKEEAGDIIEVVQKFINKTCAS